MSKYLTPKKVMDVAIVLGTHEECVLSGRTPCAACTESLNTALFLEYGHAKSATELVAMIRQDLAEESDE